MEIDLKENEWITWVSLILIAALALVGLSFIGRNATPLDAAGGAKILAWSDWQVQQARRIHNSELVVLRRDLNSIALMAQSMPDPVPAQVLQSRIAQHTRSGQPTLELSRAHLQNAADGLLLWSSGQIEREALIRLIETAQDNLK